MATVGVKGLTLTAGSSSPWSWRDTILTENNITSSEHVATISTETDLHRISATDGPADIRFTRRNKFREGSIRLPLLYGTCLIHSPFYIAGLW